MGMGLRSENEAAEEAEYTCLCAGSMYPTQVQAEIFQPAFKAMGKS